MCHGGDGRTDTEELAQRAAHDGMSITDCGVVHHGGFLLVCRYVQSGDGNSNGAYPGWPPLSSHQTLDHGHFDFPARRCGVAATLVVVFAEIHVSP